MYTHILSLLDLPPTLSSHSSRSSESIIEHPILFSWFALATYFIHGSKAMAPHSRTFAWKIPRMEEPGRLQTMGSQRVGHDWATSLSLFNFMHWIRKWQPTPVFLPGESHDGGAWWAAVCGVAQSRTWLKRLSSSSSRALHSSSSALKQSKL